MGSWNATCGITQLPIVENQRSVIIPLAIVPQDYLARDNLAGSGPSRNTGIAQPLSLPLTGTYTGYGSIDPDSNDHRF